MSNEIKAVASPYDGWERPRYYHQECFQIDEACGITRDSKDYDLDEMEEGTGCSYCYARLTAPPGAPAEVAPSPIETLPETDEGLVLVITSEAAMREVREISSKDWHRDLVLGEVLEYELCNSDWEILNPNSEDYLRIGALTSAPILSQEVTREVEREITAIGTTYGYPEYMLYVPVDKLIKHGRVVFTRAEAEEENDA